jgi:TolB protein
MGRPFSRSIATVVLLFSAVGIAAIPPAAASLPGPSGRIGFSGFRDGEQRIWTMNPDGTMARQVTDNVYPIIFVDPNMSPDGTRIVMGTHQVPDYPVSHVWTVRADGGGLADLGIGENPVWSPDGARIAFSDGNDICFMDPDGSDRSCFTGGAFDLNPSWSPDGTRIAFQRVIGNHWDIVVMNADGTGLVNVTNDDLEDEDPDWSPDGSRIVFTRLAPDFHPDIRTIGVDGSGATNLTPDAAWDQSPDWSPDGTQILFSYLEESGVFAMNADGSNRRRISDLADSDPDWSTVPPLPIEQQPSHLTIEIGRASGGRVVARGELDPDHNGARLTATLLRRSSGRFVRVSRENLRTTNIGLYFTDFLEPDGGRCKIVVRFNGDVDSLASSVSKTFPCED